MFNIFNFGTVQSIGSVMYNINNIMMQLWSKMLWKATFEMGIKTELQIFKQSFSLQLPLPKIKLMKQLEDKKRANNQKEQEEEEQEVSLI